MSFVTGHSSKKGNVIFSAGWQRQSPVFAGDRAYSEFDRDYDFTEADPTMRESIGGSSATPGGRINPAAIDFDGDGMPDGTMALCGTASACKPNGSGGWTRHRGPPGSSRARPHLFRGSASARARGARTDRDR